MYYFLDNARILEYFNSLYDSSSFCITVKIHFNSTYISNPTRHIFSSFKSGHFFSTYVNPFIIFLGVAFPAMNLFRFLFCFQLHKVFSLCLYRYVGQWLVYFSTLKISLYCLLLSMFWWEIICRSFNYPLKIICIFFQLL